MSTKSSKFGKKTGIPIISNTPVRAKLANLINKYKELKIRIHKDSCAEDSVFFLSQLFNISKCKCVLNLKSRTDAQDFQCKCSSKNDISDFQYMFYKDQISTRLLKIGICLPNDADTTEAGPLNSDITSVTTTIEENVDRLSISPSTGKGEAIVQKHNSDYSSESDSEKEYVLDPDEAKKMIPKCVYLPKAIEECNLDNLYGRYAIRYQRQTAFCNCKSHIGNGGCNYETRKGLGDYSFSCSI